MGFNPSVCNTSSLENKLVTIIDLLSEIRGERVSFETIARIKKLLIKANITPTAWLEGNFDATNPYYDTLALERTLFRTAIKPEHFDGIIIDGENAYTTEQYLARELPTHKYPVGEKVRLINGNTKGQWGTVAQHLLNGQYLVENTWLENDPMKNKDDLPTYQVVAEELIRPLATLLTVSDLKVGDVVKYIDGVSGYYRSQGGTFTVTAIGAKNVMLSGLDWHGEQIEFSHDPADLEPAIKE